MNDSAEKLKTDFKYKTWLNLGKAALISHLAFNRRRPKEIEELKMNFLKNTWWTKKVVTTNS